MSRAKPFFFFFPPFCWFEKKEKEKEETNTKTDVSLALIVLVRVDESVKGGGRIVELSFQTQFVDVSDAKGVERSTVLLVVCLCF